NQFMGEVNLIECETVHAHQQPAAQLLIDGVQAVAHSSLGNLSNESLAIQQRQSHEFAITLYFFLHQAGADAIAQTGTLNHGASGRRLAAHDKGGPHKTFRSEEHTSELQSRENLVCRLLLEKKKRI